MALAYDKNTSLAFDTTKLRENGKKYKQISEDLEKMADNLDSCLEDLKENGWSTPAGTAFHAMTQTNWKENIEKYSVLLEKLSEILAYACDKYDDLVENEVEQTKL